MPHLSTALGRALIAVVSSLAAGLVVCTVPAFASAAPVVPDVGAGLVISTSPQPGLWGHCVLAGAGRDSAGTRLAWTSGHCASLGSTIKTADKKTALGTVIARKTFTGEGALEPNELDYALIRLRRGVHIGPVPGSPIVATRIGEPRTGQIACKYGAGAVFPGERCGVIGRITPIEFDAFAFSIFGDSGGPVYTDPHTLIGMVSRPATVPFVSSTIMTRLTGAIADARAGGHLRGQFQPIA
ncbi:hypothetical protein ACPXB3_17455 [Gordonia sp. DT219]|uniref:hypothetical protein n=1 Tax=Gordonia sp. DT219 TaxID=3416658 RepID=UPI003CEEF793